jgi:glucokinase
MLRLIGDIGGTNARFGLVEEGGSPCEIRTLAVADHPGLVEAALAYLAGRAVDEAVIAVATPVETGFVHFTNSPWSFSVREIAPRLRVARVAVINDFVAQALAVPHLLPDEQEQIGGGAPLSDRRIGVIGAGTGLGVAGLVEIGGQNVALAGEGGHASFAPGGPRERALLERLAARFGHVSNERVLSGPGLLHIAQALAELERLPLTASTPEAVTQQAREASRPVCVETLRIFGAQMGSAAADLALTYGARGEIYIAGGLCLNLGELFDRKLFRARFEDKGRMRSYLEPIPVYLITRSDTGLLLGAARYRWPEVAGLRGGTAAP